MRILFVSDALSDVMGYINNRQPVIKHPHYRFLVEDQAKFFNFLYMGCEQLRSSTLPTLEPTKLFDSLVLLPGTKLELGEGLAPDVANPILMALNIVEKGTVCTLETLYGEDTIPELLYMWRFSEKRLADEPSGVAGERFLSVSLVPCETGTSKETAFTLSDELKAKKMFCAEYFKKMRTTTTVSEGNNDTLTAQFSTNPVLTALYACHLTQGI